MKRDRNTKSKFDRMQHHRGGNLTRMMWIYGVVLLVAGGVLKGREASAPPLSREPVVAEQQATTAQTTRPTVPLVNGSLTATLAAIARNPEAFPYGHKSTGAVKDQPAVHYNYRLPTGDIKLIYGAADLWTFVFEDQATAPHISTFENVTRMGKWAPHFNALEAFRAAHDRTDLYISTGFGKAYSVQSSTAFFKHWKGNQELADQNPVYGTPDFQETDHDFSKVFWSLFRHPEQHTLMTKSVSGDPADPTVVYTYDLTWKGRHLGLVTATQAQGTMTLEFAKPLLVIDTLGIVSRMEPITPRGPNRFYGISADDTFIAEDWQGNGRVYRLFFGHPDFNPENFTNLVLPQDTYNISHW